MVAETHSHRDDIDPDDIITLVAGHLDQIDSTTTLADCGYPDELALYDLVGARFDPGTCLVDLAGVPVRVAAGPGRPATTLAQLIALLVNRETR